MKIDETFLTLHPATRVWWELEPACADCKHLLRAEDRGMRCAMASPVGPEHASSKFANPRARIQLPGYCIDARSTEGACGPMAKQFVRA